MGLDQGADNHSHILVSDVAIDSPCFIPIVAEGRETDLWPFAANLQLPKAECFRSTSTPQGTYSLFLSDQTD